MAVGVADREMLRVTGSHGVTTQHNTYFTARRATTKNRDSVDEMDEIRANSSRA